MQRYTMVFITINALQVSGGSSAHHQELKPVHTASGISYCYREWVVPTHSFRRRIWLHKTYWPINHITVSGFCLESFYEFRRN